MTFSSHDSRAFFVLRSLPAAIVAALIAACSSTNDTPSDAGTGSDGTTLPSDAGGDVAPSTCSSPGAATPGPADTHCAGEDGGAAITQPTNAPSCHPDAGAGDGGEGDAACPYGDTAFGMEADDDDCKYHVKWSAGPICEGAGGVTFTIIATSKSDGSPLTGAGTRTEVFTTSPGDAGCDNQSTHPGPNSGTVLTEGPPGTYTGLVAFDAPGQWTVRLHFHEECEDLLPTSPHGHVAFHVTVP